MNPTSRPTAQPPPPPPSPPLPPQPQQQEDIAPSVDGASQLEQPSQSSDTTSEQGGLCGTEEFFLDYDPPTAPRNQVAVRVRVCVY